MIKHNQDGAVSGLAISLGMTVVLLVAALGFGGWAFMSRSDYKNNVDSKIGDAVTIAKQRTSTAKDAQFVQDEKKPYRTYKGPEAFGSIEVTYPKTWSGFIDDRGKSNNSLVDGYFYPGIVPAVATDSPSVFALRVQVVAQPYADIVKNLTETSNNASDGPPPSITPYALPRVPKVVGVKIVGTLPNKKQGEMIILPLRDKTLQVWSETAQFTPDFNASVLPNLTFIP